MQEVFDLEDLAEKKTAIYARLLLSPELAQKMEELSLRHAERKKNLEELLAKKEGVSTK